MRRRLLTAAAISLAMTPGAARAQSAAAWHDSIIVLRGSLHALRDSLEQGDSTTTEVARRGDLVAAASPKERDHAVAALDEFATAREHWFGAATPSADGFRIVVRTEQRQYDGADAARETGTVVVAGLPDTGRSERVQRFAAPRDLAKTLLDEYGRMMFAGLGQRVQEWLAFPPGLTTPDAERRQVAMYALVTGTGRAQRDCIGGDIAACAVALGIRQSTDNAARPFTPYMRSDLVLAALDLGGAGAWARFRDASNAGVEPALAAAARMPVDSLIHRWHAGLIALRPDASPVTASRVLLLVAWSAIVLAATLGASRWA